MATTTFTDRQTFDVTVCASCGIQFAAPNVFLEKRREDGKTLYCPNGHSLSWGKTDIDRLREQLEREKARLESARKALTVEVQEHQQTKHALRGQKAANTRIKNRIAKGVCPCCNRHFENLRRHMTTQHPDFRDAE